MDRIMTNAEANLILLQSVIPADEKLYVWCFHDDGTYIASFCPEHLVSMFEKAFRALGTMEKAKQLANDKNRRMPCLIGSAVGMQWAVTFEAGRTDDLIFLIGPVFYSRPDAQQLQSSLHSEAKGYQNLSWIRQMCNSVDELPVIPYSIFTRYVMMIHNTLTGEQAGLDALHREDEREETAADNSPGVRNRLKVWQNEQALLRMVAEGNINYHDILKSSSDISPGVPVRGRDPLRQQKTSVTVFTTLVSRAAMVGGLSPETAYALGDSYIQNAEDCKDSGELSALANAMYHDFIYRVHYARANPDYSHAVQKCCDYIELNLDQKLSAADLAPLVGYTEYYLTDKFRKETGVSLSSYIRDKKIERAKVLLETTALPISEIADMLAFNTPNYFIQCFRNVEGCTPARYRKKNRTQ